MSDCSNGCGGGCSSGGCGGGAAPESFMAPANEFSNVKRVIGVVSGKGGVGKSMVTSLLAVEMQRRGYQAAILDADITGPSIPKAFGLKEKAEASEAGVFTVDTTTGIKTMSVNNLLEDETDPVVWRGPVIGGTVKQFWQDVIWGDVDFMFIDMPPGTGDVALTVFQSLPIDGIVIVTSPQELVSMIVGKAVKMAQLMNVPILGMVENMSYFECPDCGNHYNIFGESHLEEVAEQYGIKNYARLPINPKLAAAVDKGMIELFEGDWLAEMATVVENTLCTKIAVPVKDGEIFQHFGHCEQFEIFEVLEGKVVRSEIVTPECSGHNAMAAFMATNRVEIVICGGIGGGAKDALGAYGVVVLAGVSGSAAEAVDKLLDGTLEAVDAVTCTKHEDGGHHHHDHEDGGCGCGCGGHDHDHDHGHDHGNSGGCGCGGGCGCH